MPTRAPAMIPAEIDLVARHLCLSRHFADLAVAWHQKGGPVLWIYLPTHLGGQASSRSPCSPFINPSCGRDGQYPAEYVRAVAEGIVSVVWPELTNGQL